MKVPLLKKISQKKATIGVIGLGYVGLPLIRTFIKAGFRVTGFDIDPKKVIALNSGKSYIKHIPSSDIKRMRSDGRFTATSDFSKIGNMDCLIICVPTPLNKQREPDLSFVMNTTKVIAEYMKKNQLIVLESTTYPGTTDEDMRNILEKGKLKAGKDFYLAFSPEREDPNNRDFTTRTIPKVVGGYSETCLELALALYNSVIDQTVPVSSTRVAEAAKLLENIYRAVNIALINELKILFDRMGINVYEVIEAAKTKPFGFQAFYPGPGLGGHCIPIDPFYLTWKARQYDFSTKFIELAGEINISMPYYVVEKVINALNNRGKSIKSARILILGLAYKKDIDDDRESPSWKLIELLKDRGASVSYNDPYIPFTKKVRKYNFSMKSVSLTKGALRSYDCILIATAHSCYDFEFITRYAPLVVDTRNATHGLRYRDKIVLA